MERQEIIALVSKGRILSTEDEKKVFEYYAEHKDDKTLRDGIIMCNMGLVKKEANHFSRFVNDEYEDLVNEGVMGMMKAVDLFDVDRGFKKFGREFSAIQLPR